MSARYMPIDSEATAAAVSAAIYRVTCPESSAGTVTKYMFGWRQAADGSWWLDWDMSLPIYVRDGSPAEIAAIVAGYVEQGRLSPVSADAILATVAANVGNTITLGDVTPPEFAALLLDALPTD